MKKLMKYPLLVCVILTCALVVAAGLIVRGTPEYKKKVAAESENPVASAALALKNDVYVDIAHRNDPTEPEPAAEPEPEPEAPAEPVSEPEPTPAETEAPPAETPVEPETPIETQAEPPETTPEPEPETPPETEPETEPEAPPETEPETEPEAPPETEPEAPASEAPASAVYLDTSAWPAGDVLFIGDSRTVGLFEYAPISGASYFAKTGLTVFSALTDTCADTYGVSETLETILSEKKFARIFIMLGVNEIGYPMDSIVSGYQTLVADVRELQPDAVLVLMSNLHFSAKKSNPSTVYNNERLNELNGKIAAMADGSTVFYLDSNPLFDDENGCLEASITFDGAHLYGKYYSSWSDYLKQNGAE